MLDLISLLFMCIGTININQQQCVDILNQITDYTYTTELVLDGLDGLDGLDEPEITRKIIHKGYDEYDMIQEYAEYAYSLGGIEFVKLIECENGRWDMYRWSNTNDYGLCQVNIPSHNVPEGFYDDAYIQLDYCYELWTGGTPFYGPNRLVKGVRCSDYVEDRFIIND